MSLPVAYFQGPWKTSAEHALTFTYDGTEYDVVIAAGTEYASMNALLWDIRGQLEAEPALAGVFWLYVDGTGQVVIESKGLTFDLTEATTASYKILEWCKLTAGGYSGVQSCTGSGCHYRGFYPLLPLLESQSFTRSLNPVRSTFRLTNGGTVHASTLTAPSTRGGFISARLKIQFSDVSTAATASQNLASLIGFLSGYRTLATDINISGSGLHAVWTGSVESALELDAMPIGGASETAFSLIDEWLDPTDYASAASYEAAHVSTVLYLHPDTKEIVVPPKWEGYGDTWVCELTVFKEGQ